MVMESRFHDPSDQINYFSLDDQNTLPIFDQFPGHATGYGFRDEPLDLSFLDIPSPAPKHDPGTVNSFPSMTSQADPPDEFTDYVSKYLNQILVEENMERNQSMFHDPFALQATEKSLYEALGKTYPPLQPPSLNFGPNFETLEEFTCWSSSEHSTHSSASGINTTDPRCLGTDSYETKSSVTQTRSLEYPRFGSNNSITSDGNDTTDSMIKTQMFQNIFTDSESILQFKRGMEEASKFLPHSKPLVIDLD